MLMSKVVWTVTLLLLFIHTVSATNKTTKEWVTSAQKTLANVGLAFSSASTAFGSHNKTKSHGHLFSTLTKKTARFAGFFGVIGNVFGVILEFISIPEGDSAEITLMKSEFRKISLQMDTIAKSVTDAKELIKVAAQQSTYLQYENDIHHGFSELNKCLKQLEDVECSGVKECKRKKALTAEGYIGSMNVRRSTSAIFRAVTSNSVFGTSFLTLLKEKTGCDIPEINLFVNKMATLFTEGMIVSIFYDLLKKYNYDHTTDVAQATDMLDTIEKSRQAVQDSCFRDFDYWMARDIQNSHSLFTSDLQISNTRLMHKLKRKFPWIVWHAVTYEGETEPETWSHAPLLQHLHSSSKSNIRSFVIPTNNETVEQFDRKKEKWVETIQTNAIKPGNVLQMSRRIASNMELRGQVQSFAILPGTRWVSGHYRDQLEHYTHGVTGYNISRLNVFIHTPATNYIIVVSFNQVSPPKCTGGFCRNNGDCYTFPYSSAKGCRCKKDYSGENCETWKGDMKLKTDINELLQYTMKLPSFASIQHAIEDTQLLLRISSENIQQSVMKLEAKIDQQLKQLGTFMSNKFEWFALLQRYKDAIENLNYFHSISSEKINSIPQTSNINISTLPLQNDTSRFSITDEKDIAKFLLSPGGIQKWLYQINFLVVGRTDSDLFSHKSLTSMIMDKHKNRVCSTEYKNEMTRTFRGLMLLQLRGYILWSAAYGSIQRDSNLIAKRFTEVTRKQQKHIEDVGCRLTNVTIHHSTEFENCTADHYIRKSLNVSVTCKDGYFLRGMQHRI